MNCALAIERPHQGEEGVFVGIFRAPEHQTLIQLQQAVVVQERSPGESRVLPHGPTLQSRAHSGTEGVLVGHSQHVRIQAVQAIWNLRAEQLRRPGAEAPSDFAADDDADLRTDRSRAGRVVVKLIYDHRVLDGAYIARRLGDIEDVLKGPVRDELRNDAQRQPDAMEGPPPNVEPLLKPHLKALATNREASEQQADRRP